MLINKVNKLQNIHNFIDFTSQNLNLSSVKQIKWWEEKTINFKNILVYAPNWSWKTNFSRFFDFISTKDTDFSKLLSKEAGGDQTKLSFSLELNNKEINQNNYLEIEDLKNIYVFNSDFIDKTLKSASFSKKIEWKLIVPIWEVSSIITDLEQENKWLLKEKELSFKKIKESFDLQEIEIEKKYKRKEINVWKEFKISNIIDIEWNIINTITNDEENFKDCEEKIEKLKSFSEDDKINFWVTKLLDIDLDLIRECINILKEPKSFNVFENKDVEDKIKYLTTHWLSEQKNIQIWIEKSEEIWKCLLCWRKVDDAVTELFSNYKNYFSQEKSKFENIIDEKIKKIDFLITKIERINNDNQAKITDYIKIFDINKIYKELKKDELIESLWILKQYLLNKKSNTSEVMVITQDIVWIIQTLNNNIESNFSLSAEINKKIDSNDSERSKLRTIIWKKYLYNFSFENKSEFEKIKSINIQLEWNQKKIIHEKTLLPQNDVLSQLVYLMNLFLHSYLWLDKYEVKENNGLITLNLNCSTSSYNISSETKIISEWEKNMIALTYYLAASIEKYKSFDEFKEVIFLIDDPISSISYWNFFWICNLLNNYDNKIIEKVWNNNKTTQKNIQKLLLTHNTQFFNMLVNNIFKDKALYFLLTPNKLEWIENKKLMSEFKTSIYRINKYSQWDYSFWNVGNDLRRFFETIRHFYGFKEQFEANTLQKIFESFEEDKHKEFYDASNYYSHSNPEIDVDSIWTINIDKIIEQFIELIWKSVFKDLWQEIQEK